SDLGLYEVSEAARLVQEAAHPDANIIFGSVIDDALGDEVRVTVIAAGFEGGGPAPRHDVAPQQRPAPRAEQPAAPSAAQPRPARQAHRPAQGAAAAAAPGAWGMPQQAFSPPRSSAAEPETETLDPADSEEDQGPAQTQAAPQPSPRAPELEPARPPHIAEPPSDDDDLDVPSILTGPQRPQHGPRVFAGPVPCSRAGPGERAPVTTPG